MSETVPVLAIDGPSGSGKGTVSRAVAERLGWNFLDSGALYRAVALAATRAGIGPDQTEALVQLAGGLELRFVDRPGDDPLVYVDGIESGAALRSEACGAMASAIAALPAVRAALVDKQRAFRRPPGLVADGRDMGTVIFPDAVLKVFLTASVAERAARRHKQLKEKGLDANIDALLLDIAARDRRDASRSVAPLRPAADAIEIDSTDVPVAHVVEQVVALLRQRLPRWAAPSV